MIRWPRARGDGPATKCDSDHRVGQPVHAEMVRLGIWQVITVTSTPRPNGDNPFIDSQIKFPNAVNRRPRPS